MDILIISSVNLFTNKTLHRNICNIAKALHSSPSCIKQNKHWLSCYLYRCLDFPTLGWRSLPQRHTAPQLDKRGVEVERLRGCRQVQSRHVLPQPKDLHFAKKCRQERRICTRKSPKDMLLPIFLPNQSSSTRSCTLLPDREAPRTFRVDVMMYILLDMIFITFFYGSL